MTRFWQHFISNGRGGVDCDRLGLHGHGIPLLPSVARRFDLAPPSGVEIWALTPDSPAERAGLRRGDVLVALAGQQTPNVARLDRLLDQLASGMAFGVVVLRGEQLLERVVAPEDNLDRAHAP